MEREERLARNRARASVIAQAYRDWERDRVNAGTMDEAVVPNSCTEEYAEMAFLTPEAQAELRERTHQALRDAGL